MTGSDFCLTAPKWPYHAAVSPQLHFLDS